jgi:plasmid stability protein
MVDQHRQIHIRVSAELHRALRLRAAVEDKSIQDLVVEILSERVVPSPLGNDGAQAKRNPRDE